jgi:hypothetical protein
MRDPRPSAALRRDRGKLISDQQKGPADLEERASKLIKQIIGKFFSWLSFSFPNFWPFVMECQGGVCQWAGRRGGGVEPRAEASGYCTSGGPR